MQESLRSLIRLNSELLYDELSRLSLRRMTTDLRPMAEEPTEPASIALQEIEIMPLSIVSDIGILFTWRGRLFRAITEERAEFVRALFDSGMLRELVNQKLFPESRLTYYQMDGYELIIEHSKIEFVSYPYEWTFSMLRDAALTALRVNRVARRFGYQTKDCHAFNIVFEGVCPRWVDLGSFERLPVNPRGWHGYDEFLRAFYYPLRLWSRGWSFIAQSLLANEREVLSHNEYVECSWMFGRFLPRYFVTQFTSLWRRYRRMAFTPAAKIRQRLPAGMSAVVCFLNERHLLPGQSVDLERWIEKVKRLHPPPPGTRWGGYQEEYGGSRYDIVSTPRFDRIVEVARECGVKSVVELGGNQGVVSRLLLARGATERVVCIDVDEEAIDRLYTIARTQDLPLWPVRLDCMIPARGALGRPPEERFRADAVLALALTHHLLLGIRLRIEFVLDAILRYGRRYVLIEFMPLGLWDATQGVEVPSWYSVDWFRQALQQRCSIVLTEQLEANRILFVGRLRSGESGSEAVDP